MNRSELFRPLVKINLGCGGNWRVDGWFGLDQSSTSFIWQDGEDRTFIEVDLKRGLPFPDNSVDVIFSSHSLEHFTYSEAIVLIFDIYRVLRVGGVICIVVPDMDVYLEKYRLRDEKFLKTPTIIGGEPRDNLADNFLMNFFSDPKFNNTCHKYGYNLENLESTLKLVGFEDFEKVDFHDFSYWPELRQQEFRSPIPNIEAFSLCVQARKTRHDPKFHQRPELQEARTYARFRQSEQAMAQDLNAALMRVDSLRAESTRFRDALEQSEAQRASQQAAFETKANEQEIRAAVLDQARAEQTAKAATLEQTVVEQQAQIAALEIKANAQEIRAALLEQARAEQTAKAATLEQVAADQHARIAALQLEISELSNRGADFEQRLTAASKEAARTAQLLIAAENAEKSSIAIADSHRKQLIEQADHVARLNSDILKANSETHRLHYLVDALSTELRIITDQNALLKYSLSWRLTKPIRDLVSKSPSGYRWLRRIAKVAYWTAAGRLPRELIRIARWRRAQLNPPVPGHIPAMADISQNPAQRLLAEAVIPPLDAARPEVTRYSPMISVVLPTYNTPIRFLKEALQSVLAQTYGAWELCIVDDGSTDPNVARVLHDAMNNDSRIRVEFANKNGGIAVSSQAALGMARGEYVAFLDHDDMLAPGALSEVVSILRNDPTIDMVYSDHVMMTEAGELTSIGLKPGWSQDFLISTSYLVHFKVMRRSFIEKLGGFSGTIDLSQDIGLSIKFMEAGARIVHCPKILYFWRMHQNSTATGAKAKPRIGFTGCATISAYLKRNNLPAEAIWPNFFRSAGIGAYKLQFSHDLKQRAAVVVLANDDTNLDMRRLKRLVEAEGDEFLKNLHLIFLRNVEMSSITGGFHVHCATDQFALNTIIEGIDCETLIFISPAAGLISPDWARELVGYMSMSPQIGAVGGKVLDDSLTLQDGAVVLSPDLPVIGRYASDNSDGHWFVGRLASNVEAVSSRLMATPKSVYSEVGGLPVFAYGDDAGIAYGLRIRRAGYRTVFNPWSKIIDHQSVQRNVQLSAQLKCEFGELATQDRYHNPAFRPDRPHELI